MSETIKAEYNGYTGYAYGVSSFSVRDKDDREIFHTGFCNKRPQTEAECLEYLKETLDLLSAYVNGTRKPSADHIVDIYRPLNCEEMTRKEAIEVLKDIVSKPMLYSNHIIGACRVALASLETDEAYQLMEEQPTIIDWNNCHTPEQLDSIATTKNDLGVDWDELKRKILMEVDGGTDDKWLRYADVCDRISNSIDEFVADMRGNAKRKGEPIEGNNESYNCENWIP